CAAKITAEDLKNPDEVEKKQAQSAKCLRDKMATVDPAELEALSQKLELQPYGLVKGKGNQEIIDYFSSRLEKALYGKDAENKVRKINQKIVDQKVFLDIYETQVGKNILLEISQYCQGRLKPKTGNKFNLMDNTNINSVNLAEWTDTVADGTSSPAEDDIYKKFVDEVIGPSKDNPELVKSRLNNIFQFCTAMVPKMCDAYEKCACKRKQDAGETSSEPCEVTPFCDKDNESYRGQHSCHVAARLRGYRTNLAAVAATQEQFKELSGGKAIGLKTPKEVYDSKTANENESIDDLTSLTSTDVSQVLTDERIKEQVEEFDAKACEKNPESKECEKYFYSQDEALKFANAGIGFQAATAVEAAKINTMVNDKDKLKKYLEKRGYLELVKQLDEGGNTEEIVKKAQGLFEAEREATFKEMNAAFERKQIVKDETKPDSTTKPVATVKSELESRSKSFQQLLLFNNVVTSYLSLQKKDSKGELQDAGLNVKALERELSKAGQNEKLQTSLSFFQNLGTGGSQIQAGENPLVDIGFLDSVLGSVEAQKREAARRAAEQNETTPPLR
ncbi:MAG: hypothetical protein ACLGG7_08760, partial [Bacteriovoracia bacterium]